MPTIGAMLPKHEFFPKTFPKFEKSIGNTSTKSRPCEQLQSSHTNLGDKSYKKPTPTHIWRVPINFPKLRDWIGLPNSFSKANPNGFSLK